MVFQKGYSPWMKGRKASEEHRKKLSDAKKGKKLSERHKKHISESRKGIDYTTPYSRQRSSDVHKGKKTFLGRKHTTESKKRISEARKNKPAWNRGKTGIYTDETLKEMSKSKRGKSTWNKGKQWSEEYKMRLSGENNPNWQGGKSFEPYCPKFNEILKERIRERDNRTCQLCREKENGRRLTVHHIHYDKENCAPDLISLCIKCHSKVNYNRDFYEALFMDILTERELLCFQQ